ncbi:MAG: LysE family translocator [Acidobacteriota bacterium]|nr:LysE family translocator [Acidobacteriota bacterium]MDE3030363.1 LysE family translocator [Acidobacteriota bacterium]MDE3093691.1 LysE family translocator [Acidobacteriota bacterium]MDE3139646.1 LysE family translocator [Acidobacteriota bacterium]
MSLVRVLPVFAVTALVLAMVPGQSMAMVLRQTLVGGARCALASVAGNASGLVVWGFASAVGLSQVFARSPLAYNLLKFAGVGYLAYLSARTLLALRHSAGAFQTNGAATTRLVAAFRLGLVTNLTNVKAAVFAVAFIPQLVPRGFSLGRGIVLLALVQALVSAGWYGGLVATVDRAASALKSDATRRALTALSAAGLLVLALVLLVSSPR